MTDETTAPSDETDGLYYVADTEELEGTNQIVVGLQGIEVAVFRVDGEYFALSNYCVHQGGPVCEGLVSGTLSVDDDWELTYDDTTKVVACPWHGWEFDLQSGEHLAQSGYKLPQYTVVTKDEKVYIEL